MMSDQASSAPALEKLPEAYDTGGDIRTVPFFIDPFFPGFVGDVHFDELPIQAEEFGFSFAVEDIDSILPVKTDSTGKAGKDFGFCRFGFYGPVAEGEIPGKRFRSCMDNSIISSGGLSRRIECRLPWSDFYMRFRLPLRSDLT
jgi:hypothetical protein